MSKKPSIDLSEFLPKKGQDLSEFLPPSVQQPSEVLSPPELVVLHWIKSTCSCGREYSSQEYGPLIRHTISRRIGFGLREMGKVFIPMLPGLDISDLPQEVRTKHERIYACPSCLGTRPSLPLFPEDKPAIIVNTNGTAMFPHAAAWFEAHKTSRQFEIDETLKDMHKRAVDFDDLLAFKTTKMDLQSVAQSLCDPESQT